MGINDVYPNDLIEKAAEELKKVEAVKPPVWADYAKTGAHRERAPADKDWWYKRAAAVLRSISVLGPVGVNKLRIKYGGKKRRGHKPPQFRKGSGSVIRKVLQQLDKAGFTKFAEKGIHKGRIITKEGKLFLNNVVNGLVKSQPVKKEQMVEKKIEPAKEKKSLMKEPEKRLVKAPKKEMQEEEPDEKI
jgi:small subunit ribosomal protein S19e